MIKRSATILEIGSSKLKAINVSAGLNNTFVVQNSAEVLYEGYFQGEFVDERNFKDSLVKLFNLMDYRKRGYTKKIYVGLPAEFLSVTSAQVSESFRYPTKIKRYLLDNMFESACEKVNTGDSDVVSVSPISFVLDDDGIYLTDPIGKKANTITADISIVLAKKRLIEKFNQIFFNMGFERIEYIGEILAEAQYVIPDEAKEEPCVLVDCGHLTTSVSIVQGDGLLETKTFSIGGGHISGDLSEIFELTYKDAERFKEQIVVTLQGGFNDKYELITEGGTLEKINLNEANNAVAYRIEEIAKVIQQIISDIPSTISSYMPIYLVGCGIASIKGGKNLLSKLLNRNVIEGLAPLPGRDKPEHACIFSLAEYATKKCK